MSDKEIKEVKKSTIYDVRIVVKGKKGEDETWTTREILDLLDTMVASQIQE